MTSREIKNHLETKGFKYNEKTREFINKRNKAVCFMNRRERDMKNYFYADGIEWLVDDMKIENSNKGYFGLVRQIKNQ